MLRIVVVSGCLVLAGCAAKPLYDENQLLPDPCQFRVFPQDGEFYAAPVRNPIEPGFAQGAFGAAMRMWVTYPGDKTELITVRARPTDDKVVIHASKPILVVGQDNHCQAFAALPNQEAR